MSITTLVYTVHAMGRCTCLYAQQEGMHYEYLQTAATDSTTANMLVMFTYSTSVNVLIAI